ncbi:816_t:CDS:2 [Ambispora leptoticha]|uniref:chitin synthase n=1 Tax=Ambispora leptoticha TaxID=144679 RepID=A0A9N8YS79_9GLOM|nr:816_t:CDS:2 [Ambispora leptoticha]
MDYNYEPYQPPYSPAPSTLPPAPTRTPPPNSFAPPNPSTAIFNAVVQNNVGLLSSILNKTSFDLNNLRNRDGKTPLMVAASENCFDVVRFLTNIQTVKLDLQDNDGESALYQAASNNSIESVEILISAGAYVESGNKENITPLIIAAYNGNATVCAILLDQGHANVNQKDSSNKTALTLAAYEGHSEVVKVLLARGANVNMTDQFGWTPMMLAAYANRVEACQILLMHNADRQVATSNGKTAAVLARDAGYFHIADMIENFGADPLRSPYGMSQNSYNSNAPPSHQVNYDNAPRHRHVPPQNISITDNNLYSDPYSVRGHMMPLERRDTRRVALQAKNAERRRSEYLNLNANKVGPRAGELRTAPHVKQDMRPRDDGSPWVIFSLIITGCCCNPCLSSIGKMKDPNIRQAWREKVALCFIILCISGFMGFLTFGLSTLACQKKVPLYPQDILRLYGPQVPGQKVHIIRGKLYNTGVYFLSGSHRPIAPLSDADLAPIITPLFGSEIKDFFPPNYKGLGCQSVPKNTICQQGDPRYHCHTSLASQKQLENLFMNLFVGFTWTNITDGDSKLFVYNGDVYDLTQYLDPQNSDYWLGDGNTTQWLRTLVGRDATKDIVRSPNSTQLAKCFEHFKVGQIDGTTIGCFATNLILIVMTVIFTGITLIKFVSAMTFDWFLSRQLGKISKKPKRDDAISHILLLVTCYSEGVESMRTTLDSLAGTDYSDRHKLLFVIADGDITGSDNDKSTPQICIDLLETQFPDAAEPEPMSYIAIGDGMKQHNMAKVYTGYYNVGNHHVPMCLIIKCGTEEERKGPKAGNRGKRDSQLILMTWLSHVYFNDRLSPLEFDLFQKVRGLTGVTPDKYDMVLMVDADTLVKPDSVSFMVAAMERDPKVMGLCGETKIANKTASWVSMIQVFEYYISHHLGKSFESIFGGVTCLPGCFCMYRIKAPKYDGSSVPILCNPDIVEMYSSNTVETLHQKNLLLLGEDRYLTTLMLRTFPKRKMIYVPKAICKTVVPDEFNVLLSQRRRWINSTIHNLMELILVPQLCGIFCCSMQFVIFLELVGTVVLPSSLLFMIYLGIVAAQGQNVLLPLLFIAATYFLQAFLIVFTSHKPTYILWMMVFIFAMPVWNFLLPLYAFWHFDDFSWGATRKIAGVDNGHGDGGGNVFDPNSIPMKRWNEWMLENKTKELPVYSPSSIPGYNNNDNNFGPPSPGMTMGKNEYNEYSGRPMGPRNLGGPRY